MKRFFALILSMRPLLALTHSGLPLMGYLLAAPEQSLERRHLILFLIAVFLLALHVLLLNNVADGDTGRYVRPFCLPPPRHASLILTSLLFFLLTLILALWVNPFFFLGTLAVSGVWALYALPPMRWKEHPLLSKGLHFFAGILHFMLGSLAFSRWDSSLLIPGVGFGILLTAGHLIHEILDIKEDEKRGVMSFARRFSPNRAYFVALGLFALATGCFYLANEKGKRPFAYFVLTGWITFLVGSLIGLGIKETVKKAHRFQRFFRLTYALTGIAFVWHWFRP